MYAKDIQGLYHNGGLIATSYPDAVKILFQLGSIPKGFCINEDEPQEGYSIVDAKGVQHIYELSPKEFYSALMEIE